MNALLSSSFFGLLWLGILFALCFFGVHIVKLAKIGREYQKRNAEKQPPSSEPPSDKPSAPSLPQQTPKERQKPSPPSGTGEPVYYIVERKRRTKSSFGEPKEIKFK